MKKNYIFKRVALGLLGSAMALGVSAQEYPEFEVVTPEGAPNIFRGNANWGDYNNDGKLELISVGRDIGQGWATFLTLYTWNGTGFDFTHELDIPYEGVYDAVVDWIDYNNDGNLDLFYMGHIADDAEANIFIKIYKNTGAAGKYAFEEVLDLGGLRGLRIEEESMYGCSFAFGDYNNDGYTDILLTGRRDGERRVELYKNENGTGKFSYVEGVLDGGDFNPVNGGSAAFADFNNDGLLDIIVNGWSDSANDGDVFMYLNNGDGTFRDNYLSYDLEDPSSKGEIGVADLNGDGYLDFIVSGELMDGGAWRKITGVYLFASEDEGLLSYEYLSADEVGLDNIQKGEMDFADFNSDGILDIVMVGEGAGPRGSVFMGNESGVYDAYHDLMTRVRSGAVISLGDFDNDGYLDAVNTGYGGDDPMFSIFKNKGNLAKNGKPGKPSNLKSSYADGKMTFTWDAGTDAETPAAALRYNFYLKRPNGEIYTFIPADINTGRLKTANTTTLLTTTTLTLNLPEGEYDWGVQTVDQNKMGSDFAHSSLASIEDLANGEVKVYGLNGQITVSTPQAAVVKVYDIAGKLVNHSNTYATQTIGSFEKGVYVVVVEAAGQQTKTKIVL